MYNHVNVYVSLQSSDVCLCAYLTLYCCSQCNKRTKITQRLLAIFKPLGDSPLSGMDACVITQRQWVSSMTWKQGCVLLDPLLNAGRWESAHICARRGKAVCASLSSESLLSSVLHEILECKAETRQLISRWCFLVYAEAPRNPLCKFLTLKHFLCYNTEAQVTD